MTYLFRDVPKTVVKREWFGTKCDSCGAVSESIMFRVFIAVHEGEEMGGTDEYDYCEDCILVKAPLLVAAGSTAPLVTGEDEESDEGDDVG